MTWREKKNTRLDFVIFYFGLILIAENLSPELAAMIEYQNFRNSHRMRDIFHSERAIFRTKDIAEASAPLW